MTDVSHQVEAALADMWYVEEALAHFATIYREAVYRAIWTSIPNPTMTSPPCSGSKRPSNSACGRQAGNRHMIRRTLITISCDYSQCTASTVIEAADVQDARDRLAGGAQLEQLDLCPVHAEAVRPPSPASATRLMTRIAVRRSRVEDQRVERPGTRTSYRDSSCIRARCRSCSC
jgi:hypothetical protein